MHDSLYFSDHHLQVREMARKFADEVVAPRARELDETEEFPADLVKQMAELGFLGLPYPEKYGGAGMDWFFAGMTDVFFNKTNGEVVTQV